MNKSMSFQKIFEGVANKFSKKIAVSYMDKYITYEELNKKANGLANHLKSLGISKDKRVAIICDRDIETIIGIVAILKAGGAYVPIESSLPYERIKFIIKDSESTIVLTGNVKLEDVSVSVINLFDNGLYIHSEEIGINSEANDLALVIYTSGTTGTPKGVMIEYSRFIKNKNHIENYLKITEQDVILQFASLSFAASFEELTMAFLTGSELCVIPHGFIIDTKKFEKYLVKHKVSVIMVPPQYLLNFENLSVKKIITAGGAALPTITEHISCYSEYYNNYGSSEIGMTAFWYMSQVEPCEEIPLGKAICNTTIYIADGNRICSPMEKGEICITSIGMARGYLNQPELTAEKFVNNPFGEGKIYRSGDYGRVHPDGNIEYLGRKDEQVELQGHRIELREIENVIRKLPLVEDCAVILKKYKDNEKIICAFVTGKISDPLALKKSLHDILPQYMVPAHVIKLEEIPLNNNGKVDRIKLTEVNLTTFNECLEEKNEVQELIANEFCQILKLSKIGLDDSFFEWGGHSLRAIKLINKIEEKTGIRLELKLLFENPTVRLITQYISEMSANIYKSILRADNRECYPMSSAQKRIYLISQLEGNKIAYNIPQCLRLQGNIHINKIRDSLESLLKRHEILRTEFVIYNGELVQKILETVELDFRVRKDKVSTVEYLLSRFIQPFKLENAPLVRAEIIERNEEHLLLIDMHHIICDGMSMGTFINELCALYNGEELAEPRQYKDYSEWMSLRDISLQKEFWVNQFTDEIPVLNMPLDFMRPNKRSFQGATLYGTTGAELAGMIKEFSRQFGVTTYMILLSVAMVLLSKYSLQEDIVIGSPVSARIHKDTEKMLGMFANTLAMRGKPEGKKRYFDFLQEIKQTCLKAYDNQEYPLEELVEAIEVKWDMARNPLFDVMLVLQNNEEVQFLLKGIEIEPVKPDVKETKFDLTFNIHEMNENIFIEFEYCKTIFKENTAKSILKHFIILLRQVMEKPNILIEEIDIATEEERRIIGEFNNTDIEYTKDKTVVQLFEEQVERSPGNIALVFESEEVTYREFNAKVNQLARRIREIGIKPEDFVAIIAERSIEMLVGIFGIIKAGAAYVPIDPTYPEERVRFILADCSPKLILSYKASIESEIPIIDLADSEAYAILSNNLELVHKSRDLIYCIYTSGTSGIPKGVLIENVSIVSMHNHFDNLYKVKETDKVLQFFNYVFDGFVWEMVVSLLFGATLYLITNEIVNDISKFNKYIVNNKITIAALPPQYFLQTNISGLKILVTAGSESNRSVVDRAMCNERYINEYGPTECTVQATVWEYDTKFPIPEMIPIGRPVSNTKIYIVNGDKLCGIGMLGELCIVGEGLARGYLNQAELTARKFVKNPFGEGMMYRTGDLARWNFDGNIEYWGRIDEQVKVRGYRIELGEIESRLHELDGIKDAAVISREDNYGDKEIYGYIVSDNTCNLNEIRVKIAQKLPYYMVPAYLMQIDKIPVTRNGKIDKRALPVIEAKSEMNYIAPRNELEKIIVHAFEEVLEIEKVSVSDCFFALGGNSLKAMRVINKIEAETGSRVPLKVLFAHSTGEGLQKQIGMDNSIYLPIPIVNTREFFPMSSAQKRIFILNQIGNNGITYNMPFGLRVKRDVIVEEVKSAVYELIVRHEILRTEFTTLNGDLVQHIKLENELDLGYFKYIENEDISEEDIFSRFIQPFNLEKAPLMRVELIKRKNEYLLLLDINHIISDGMSMRTFINEFCSLYNGKKLAETRQYKDYSEWMRTRDISSQKDYWIEQFNDEIQVLDMPLDFVRQKQQCFEGSIVSNSIGVALAKLVNELKDQTGTTTYMILLAVAMITLSKYSLQEDIVIGSPVSARLHKDTEKMLGMFTNTLAMRGKPKGEKSYVNFLQEVKETCLKAFENQEYPFEELVEALNVQRNMARNPLFDVMLVLQNNDEVQYNLRGHDAEYISLVGRVAKFDLTFNIHELNEDIYIDLEYCNALFKENNAKNILKHFLMILNQVVVKPNILIEELDIATEDERGLILGEFNDTAVKYPFDKTVVQLFEEQVERSPENIALIFEKEKLTYRELNAKVNQLAWRLRELNVKANDLIAIMAERSIEMIIGIYGIIKAGAAYVPIDPTCPNERVRYMLRDSNSKMLLFYKTEIETDIPIVDLGSSESYAVISSNLERINKTEDLVYCIYTSGTTGNPKGVLIENTGIVSMHNYLINLYNVKETDKILQFSNYVFDASVWEMTISLLSGATLCLVSSETIGNVLMFNEYIETHNISLALLPPSYFLQMSIKGLRVLTTGGSAANSDIIKNIPDGTRYINAYGPTENTVLSTHWEYSKTDNMDTIPIGRPISNTKIFILNRDKLCGIGMPGELCIVGDGLARGYLNQPILTDEKFVKNPFGSGRMYRSGDLARWMDDGNIEYLGRIDEQVKIRGYRIELGEIESKLRGLCEIKDAAVIVHEDGKKDKVLCGYIVSDKTVNINEIKEQLSRMLPNYMVPTYLMQIEKMPMTQSGKLNKQALSVLESSRVKDFVAPRDEVEIMLCRMFEEILGLVQVGIMDDFFELGGHSLRMMKLINKIETEMGFRISFIVLFEKSTVQQIRQHINELSQKNYETIPVAEVLNYYPMSASQKRIYLINLMEEVGVAYNIPQCLRLKGKVQIERIKEALEMLVERHEILRTEFLMLNDDLVQRIKDSVEIDFEVIEDKVSSEEELFSRFIQPFDLEKAPLIRAEIIVRNEEHLFLIDMHHIIGDGVSMGTLINEISDLYNGEVLVAARQYKDYSEWMRSRDLSSQQEYWVNEFAEEITVLDMPLDFERPKKQSFEGAMVYGETGMELTKLVKSLSRETDTTIYMVMLSVAMVVLSKYSFQEEIVIGSPFGARIHKDTEKMLGMFTNTLVLRGKPEGKKRYINFLQEVKDTCLNAYVNQEYPFDELVKVVDVRRDRARNPLFDVMFMLQNNDEMQYHMNEIENEYLQPEVAVSKFDLTFNIKEANDSIYIELQYCSALYIEDSATRILKHFIRILEQIVEQPEILIKEIDMATEEERRLILGKFNDTSIEYPKNKTIVKLFEEQVKLTPEKNALLYKGEKVSYQVLNEKANQLAWQLRKLDVKPNDFVAIMAERSIEMIVGLYGIIKAGAAYVPIDPTYPEERIRFILEDCKPKALLSYKTRTENDIPIIDLAEIEGYAGMSENLENVNIPEDLVYCIYTSGTTGKPKGVLIENSALCNYIQYAKAKYVVGQIYTPFFTNYCFDLTGTSLFLSTLNGGTLQVLPEDNELDIEKVLFKTEYTIAKLTPQHLRMHLDTKIMEKMTSLKSIIVGGESFKSSIALEILEKYGNNIKIHNEYGPTEATIGCCDYIYSKDDRGLFVSIGRPISNIKIYVLNGNKLCGIGMIGELCIVGAGLARGYLNQPELTATKFVKNPFGEGRMYRSGDLSRWKSDGNLECLGRIDEQVKIRGFRIELGAIENKLCEIDGIKDAVVTIREDDNMEKMIFGYVVSDRAVNINELREQLNKKLPYYMIPTHLMQLDKIPVTKNGKLDRRALPKIVTSRDREYVAPRNYVEIMLCRVFEEVLGVDTVGVKDDFFELGGDSIKAIRIVSKARESGYKITYKKVMLECVIEKIANVCEEFGRVEYEQGEVVGEVITTPIINDFQKWALLNPAHYNQSIMMRMDKKNKIDDIKNVLIALVKHHDILRAIYIDGKLEILSMKYSHLFDFEVLRFEEVGIEEQVEAECIRIQKSMDLKNGPLMKVALIQESVENHLLIVVHHLVIDGVSWRIIIEDLNTGLYQLMVGKEIKFPLKTASFKTWSEALDDYKGSKMLKSEKHFWNKVLLDAEKGRLKVDVCSMKSDYKTINIEFSLLETKKLTLYSRKAFTTEINDLLLSALGMAMGQVMMNKKLAVIVEGHGREEINININVDRTVGWFTSTYPVVVSCTDDIEDTIISTKDKLRSIPNHGIGYGLLKEELPDMQVDVYFNYLGEMDTIALSSFSRGMDIALENKMVGIINFNGCIEQGQLNFKLSYDRSKMSDNKMEQLALAYQNCLNRIVDYCANQKETKKTPSDFTAKNLSVDDINNISQLINDTNS